MYCDKCGYKLTGKEKYCPKCGSGVNGSDKGKKPEKQEKGHKSIRWIVIFGCVLVILIAGLILYLYFNRTKEGNGDVQVQSETVEIEGNTRSKPETEEINYQGMVMDYRYLDKDELFCLKLTNAEMIYVDLEGKVQQPDKLNSDYLDTEAIANDDGRVYDTEIYDINGNQLGLDSLFGVNFELDGQLYYPRIDGTTRICIADKVTNVLAKLKMNTIDNTTLATRRL